MSSFRAWLSPMTPWALTLPSKCMHDPYWKSRFWPFCAMVESSTGWSRAQAGKMASGWRKTNDMTIHDAKLCTSSQHTRSLGHSLHSIR